MKIALLPDGRAFFAVLAVLGCFHVPLAALDGAPIERPDHATIVQALEGDQDATEALVSCADGGFHCSTVAAAALHRQGRFDELIDLLQPRLARGDQHAARIVAEIAFEQGDYRLAWAGGSIWMEAGDLELPDGQVADPGMRIPWLMGQSLARLSESELERARELVEEIRSAYAAEERAEPVVAVEPVSLPAAKSRVAPDYPRELVEAGAGGWALLLLAVAADGTVEDVRTLFASHEALADSSIEAIRQWRFEPADQGPWWSIQIMEFELSDWPSAIPEAESGIADEKGWIRFDNSRGWIEFTVRVNGVPARAMLDSGASSNAISRRLVERAGVSLNMTNQVRVRGVYGQRNVPVSGEFELGFGSATVPMRGALVLPGSSPDLILGVRLFQASVVQIDYPNKRIRFLNRDAVDFKGNVRVRTQGGRSPQVATELKGRRVWMLLDTGNSGSTLIKSSLVRRMGLDQYQVDHPGRTGFGAVASGRSRLLHIPDFQLGPFPFETLLASYIEEGGRQGFEGRRSAHGSRLRQDNAPYDGILG
ncbi:MAG: TonB family protein, partial [Wenzhouxiangellaceae bacterium]